MALLGARRLAETAEPRRAAGRDRAPRRRPGLRLARPEPLAPAPGRAHALVRGVVPFARGRRPDPRISSPSCGSSARARIASGATVDVHQHLWPEAFIAELRAVRRHRAATAATSCSVEGRATSTWKTTGSSKGSRRWSATARSSPRLPPADPRRRRPAATRARGARGGVDLRDPRARHRGRRAVAGVRSGTRTRRLRRRLGRRRRAGRPRRRWRLSSMSWSGGRRPLRPPGRGPRATGPTAWWTSVVDYTAGMQAAYFAWLGQGRGRWPALRVLFAILAGGAPFQLERLGPRGIDVRSALDPNVFFDVATYGRRALELCIETFGVGQLVYGSDHPVVEFDPHAPRDRRLRWICRAPDTYSRTQPLTDMNDIGPWITERVPPTTSSIGRRSPSWQPRSCREE